MANRIDLNPVASSGEPMQRILARLAALEQITSGQQRVGSYDNTTVTMPNNASITANVISSSITNTLFVPNPGMIVGVYAQGCVWGDTGATGTPELWLLVQNTTTNPGTWITVGNVMSWTGSTTIRSDNVFTTGGGVGVDFTENNVTWGTGNPYYIPMAAGAFRFALGTNIKSGTGSGATKSDRRFISAWLS